MGKILQTIFPGVGPNERTTWKTRIQLMCAEFIGTAILMFVGCFIFIDTITHKATVLTICLTFGIAVTVAIMAVGHVSGAHINPVLTIAAIFVGGIREFILLPLYIISQLLGGIFGYGIIRAVTPTEYFYVANTTSPGFCVTMPSEKIALWQALLVEVALTFCLTTIFCGVLDIRNANNTDSTSIKFGLAVCGLAATGASYTGGSMNPARSLAPAVFNSAFKNHWIYWAGPILGGLLSVLVYRLCFSLPLESKSSDEIP